MVGRNWADYVDDCLAFHRIVEFQLATFEFALIERLSRPQVDDRRHDDPVRTQNLRRLGVRSLTDQQFAQQCCCRCVSSVFPECVIQHRQFFSFTYIR